jgi:SAM-dependent methyltransferase
MTALVCPNCSGALDIGELGCRACGVRFRTRYGIPSFVPHEHGEDELLSEDELVRFAERTTERSVRHAIDELEGARRRRTLDAELTSVNRDNWRILASDHLRGRCLDANAGFGRRARAIAPLSDAVYTLDSNVHKLRVARERARSLERGSVRPVHAAADTLPFERDAFDTIVLDLYDRPLEAVRSTLQTATSHLAEGGSIVVFTNGGLGAGKIVDDVLAGRSPTVPLHRPTTHGRLRGALRSRGFVDIETLSFLPSYSAAEYVFDGGNRRNYDAAFESELTGLPKRASKAVVRAFDRASMLSECTPVACVVARYEPNEASEQSDEPSTPLVGSDADSRVVIPGRARAIVLERADGRLRRVRKVPNETRYESINENEHRVVDRLRRDSGELADSFPTGDLVSSRMGRVRREAPVSGTQLSERISDGTISFERCVGAVFDWLVAFQEHHRGQSYEKPPSEIRAEISKHGPGKRVRKGLTLFDVPVHGDLVPENVFVDDGCVSAVIDWEYGRLCGNPIVDAGYFLLRLGKELFGDFAEGFEQLFVRDTRYSDALRRYVGWYCDRLGLEPDAFYYYLPLAYTHRIEMEAEHDVRVGETSLEKRFERIELVHGYERERFRVL